MVLPKRERRKELIPGTGGGVGKAEEGGMGGGNCYGTDVRDGYIYDISMAKTGSFRKRAWPSVPKSLSVLNKNSAT